VTIKNSIAEIIIEVFKEAGVPDGVDNVVLFGARE
jgi:acyl-CoA reductase-like NAD-dependent aldehyde dehydrogenase